MPAYWLGAFFYPRGLLALLKQDCYRQHGQDRGGNIEQFVFQTEITSRDKDHVRRLLLIFYLFLKSARKSWVHPGNYVVGFILETKSEIR